MKQTTIAIYIISTTAILGLFFTEFDDFFYSLDGSNTPLVTEDTFVLVREASLKTALEFGKIRLSATQGFPFGLMICNDEYMSIVYSRDNDSSFGIQTTNLRNHQEFQKKTGSLVAVNRKIDELYFSNTGSFHPSKEDIPLVLKQITCSQSKNIKIESRISTGYLCGPFTEPGTTIQREHYYLAEN